MCTYAHAHAHAPGYPHARTHQYVIIIAFPQQQWFHERTSMLGYTYKYIACLLINILALQAWHANYRYSTGE